MAELVMNPFVDVHIHPQPEAFPIDLARITRINVRCPVRGQGLRVREVTPATPELFAFFLGLVAQHGELALDSDAPLVDDLIDLGFLVPEDAIVDWPPFAIPLTPGAAAPAPDAIVSPSFLYQPAFALHPGLRWPPDYDEQDGRLRCFSPGPAFWLGDPASFIAPVWVSDEAAASLAALVPGSPAPPLPAPLARALFAAGALVSPSSAPRPVADRFAHYRAAYQRDGFVIAHDLLPAAEVAALRRYYAALLAADLLPLGDYQTAARFSSYNDPVGRFIHARLTATMSAVAGQPLEPSFSYFFSYLPGAVLEPHKDRAQAEFSISLQLDHTPPPDGPTNWPLELVFDHGRTASANLALGDAVLYHGRTVTHFRAPLPAAQRSSLLVLEYVPLDFPGLRI
jgi:hypothetical protein